MHVVTVAVDTTVPDTVLSAKETFDGLSEIVQGTCPVQVIVIGTSPDGAVPSRAVATLISVNDRTKHRYLIIITEEVT